MLNEIVFAWRRSRRRRAFALFSVLTLAIGIAAVTVSYAVIEAALLRPPPIRDVGEVVNVYNADPFHGASGPGAILLSLPDIADLRRRQTVCSHLTAWARIRPTLTIESHSEPLLGEAVDAEYFETLKVNPAAGRLIAATDHAPGAPAVAVISEALWRSRFGGDHGIIGARVLLNGHPFEVVGVAEPAFKGVDMPNIAPAMVWTPLPHARLSLDPTRIDPHARDKRWLQLRCRLNPRRTWQQASAEIAAIGDGLDIAYPTAPISPGGAAQRRAWHVIPAADITIHESVQPIAQVLAAVCAAVAVLVLLTVCSNVSYLTLARDTSRQDELVTHLFLGASRTRLIAASLAESAVISALGLALALALARVSTTYMSEAAAYGGPGIALRLDPVVGTSAFVVATAAAFVSAVVCGLVAAARVLALAGRPASASQNTHVIREWRGHRTLLVAQVSVSTVLVLVSLFCIRQARREAEADAYANLDRLAFARLDLRASGLTESAARAALQNVVDRVASTRHVARVALTTALHDSAGRAEGFVSLTADDTPSASATRVRLIVGSVNLLHQTNTRLIEGREFTASDTAEAQPVAIISRSLAAALFGDESAVGRVVHLQRLAREPRADGAFFESLSLLVVGVASDARVRRGRASHVIYQPFTQHYDPNVYIAVTGLAPLSQMLTSLRTAVLSEGLGPALRDAGGGQLLIGPQSRVLAGAAWICSVVGFFALFVALAGLWGSLACLVAERTRATGVRVALGARTGDIVTMVLGDGLRPVGYGLGVGVLAGFALRGWLVPVFDFPWLEGGVVDAALVAGAFLIAALIACGPAAMTAARLDPAAALRHL